MGFLSHPALASAAVGVDASPVAVQHADRADQPLSFRDRDCPGRGHREQPLLRLLAPHSDRLTAHIRRDRFAVDAPQVEPRDATGHQRAILLVAALHFEPDPPARRVRPRLDALVVEALQHRARFERPEVDRLNRAVRRSPDVHLPARGEEGRDRGQECQPVDRCRGHRLPGPTAHVLSAGWLLEKPSFRSLDSGGHSDRPRRLVRGAASRFDGAQESAAQPSR